MNTDADAVRLRIAGSVFDPNLAVATVGVFFPGPDARCDVAPGGDDIPVPEGDGPGEVDDQSQNITDSADDFSVVFVIQNTEIPADVVVYCLAVDAADSAKSKDGSPNPNTSRQTTQTTVTWNP